MSTEESGPGAPTTGAAAVMDYLEGCNVPFELLEHEPTMSAVAEARAVQRPPEQVAKTLILRDRGGYVVAVIPASERLDLRRLRDVLGASRSLRMAGELEIAQAFPTVEVGAAPPLGATVPTAEVVDRRLVAEDQIVCAGGDHRHAIALDPRDLVWLTSARIADLCADDDRRVERAPSGGQMR